MQLFQITICSHFSDENLNTKLELETMNKISETLGLVEKLPDLLKRSLCLTAVYESYITFWVGLLQWVKTKLEMKQEMEFYKKKTAKKNNEDNQDSREEPLSIGELAKPYNKAVTQAKNESIIQHFKTSQQLLAANCDSHVDNQQWLTKTELDFMAQIINEFFWFSGEVQGIILPVHVSLAWHTFHIHSNTCFILVWIVSEYMQIV